MRTSLAEADPSNLSNLTDGSRPPSDTDLGNHNVTRGYIIDGWVPVVSQEIVLIHRSTRV